MAFIVNTWFVLFFIAWILLLATFLVYANYKGWLQLAVLSSLARPRLYFILRCFRTFSVLFVSVSVIGFLYYETDLFSKGVPEYEIWVTREQYERMLQDRSRAIEEKIKYADKERANILRRQQASFEEKLVDLDNSYSEYVADLVWHKTSLRTLYGQAPADLLNRARQAMADGNLVEADIFLEAIENTATLDSDKAGRLSWARGFLAEQAGNYMNAYKHFSRAARFMADNPELEIQAAWIALQTGDYRASKTHYEQALAENIRLHGGVHEEVADGHRSVARICSEMEDYREALMHYEKALQIDMQVYGNDHPQVAQDLWSLGWVLGKLQRHREALPYLERALASNLKNPAKDMVEITGCYAQLGHTWMELQDYRKSVMYYQQALDTGQKVYDEDQLELAYYRYNLGWLWGALGENGKAITYLELALVVYRKHYSADNPEVMDIQQNLKELRKGAVESGRRFDR